MFNFESWIFPDIKKTKDFRKIYVSLTFRVDCFLSLKNSELYDPGQRRFIFLLKCEALYVVREK